MHYWKGKDGIFEEFIKASLKSKSGIIEDLRVNQCITEESIKDKMGSYWKSENQCTIEWVKQDIVE